MTKGLRSFHKSVTIVLDTTPDYTPVLFSGSHFLVNRVNHRKISPLLTVLGGWEGGGVIEMISTTLDV